MATYDSDIDYLSRELITIKNDIVLKSDKKTLDSAINYLNIKIKELTDKVTSLQVAVDLLKE